MNRWKASGLHLALSILVVGGIALTALFTWFPHGLYRVANLDRLLIIMLGIDLTMGPLLTLVVYKPAKPSLKFDLAFIAVCQMAFLMYGLHTLWGGRPVFLVASDVRMTLVFANEISENDLKAAPRPEWRKLSWTGPVRVGVETPHDPKEKQALLAAFLERGVDVENMPRYYVDFSQAVPGMLAKSHPDPEGSRPGGKTSRKVPLLSGYGEAWMRVDGDSGAPIEVMPR